MKSMVLGGYWDEVDVIQHEYTSLHGGAWAASESSVGSVISTAGTLRNLRVKTIDSGGTALAPGSGKHYIFTVRKNSVDTNLVVTISDAETEGSDLTNEVSVVAGDVITLQKTYDADIGVACYVRSVTEFEGSLANASMVFGGSVVIQYYLDRFLAWTAGVSSTAAEVRQICAVAGTIKSLCVKLSVAPDPDAASEAVAGGWVFTLRVNGEDTGLILELKYQATSGCNHTGNVSVSPGDIITIGQTRSDSGNPTANAVVWYATTFVAATDGEVPLPFGSGSGITLNAGATEYSFVSHHTVWTAEEYKPRQYATPCYLDWLYVTVSVAPGSGKSWTFTVMKNGVATDLWAIITGTDTSSYKSVDPELRVDLGDELTLRCEPSGTPAAAYGFGGLRSLWRTVTTAEVITKSATSIAAENATWKATLNGELIDDGDQDCEVRFQYGLDTSYGTDTSWVSQAEGDFSKVITGLTANTIYHFRAQAKNSSGTVSGVDMEFGTYEQIYPTIGLTRVTGLIHRWSPGNYTLEVTLGGVMAEFGMPQFTMAPAPSMPTPPSPPPVPAPPDIPPPVVITCPPGYRMTYDYFDVYSQHPYCVPDWEEPPVPEPPPINFQYCQQLMQQLEQGRQVYMRTYYVYISMEDYARHVGQLSEYLACKILMG